VSDALDDELVERVDSLGTRQWSGACFRYTSAMRDPLSGEGARRFGGRWNKRGLFSAIYLCDSTTACMVELERAAAVASTTAQNKLRAPHKLHHINASDLTVLDLRTTAAQLTVGLEPADLTSDDWTACQQVGHAAWFLHTQAILVPAAGGIGLVITAYEQRIRPGQLTVLRSDDLTPETYEKLRATS
jgi:RES domain-containing protein